MSAPNTCDREQQQQGIWTSPAASSPRYSTSPLAPIIEASCCSGGNSSFVPCCICLDIHSKDNTILRPECFHRFCRTCANNNDYIQLWKSNKCPACQKDLDETLSDVLQSPPLLPQFREPNDSNDPTIIPAAENHYHHHLMEKIPNIDENAREDTIRSSTLAKEKKRKFKDSSIVESKKTARDERGAAVEQSKFEENLAKLVAFNAKNGHCNAPNTRTSEDYSLGQWCNQMRILHKQMQNGNIPVSHPLSEDQIHKLEEVGFNWVRNTSFDKRLAEIAAYKAKYGHCNVPQNRSRNEYSPLAKWCAHTRALYKQIQNGQIPRRPLSQDQIERLDTLGFKWSKKIPVCEKRWTEFDEFIAIHGHFQAPQL